LLLGAFAAAHADAALLLMEPYGAKGKFNSTGHAAVYLTDICAETPTHLRRCEPGEGGVVISRYNKVSNDDWLAMPLLPYLYAVETIEDIPQSADEQSVAALRESYRRAHLMDLVPDEADANAPRIEWVQLVGAAYVRTIYGYQIHTTPEQDAAFIERWNRRENRNHFNLLFHNCANFAADVMNFFAPHAVHRNFFADAGLMTPKQVAMSITRHARRHPEVGFSAFIIPQVPGRLPRSKPANGMAEMVVKSKKYLVPMAFFHPIVTGTIAAAYLTKGRFDPKRDAGVFDISRAFQPPQSREAPATAKAASPGPASALTSTQASR